jgi:hypothetical protein
MKHNEANERIKRAYRLHMKAARGLSDATIDVASAAIHRFEEDSAFRPFNKFHFEQAIAFRRRLDGARNERTAQPISKSTALQVLTALRGWVALALRLTMCSIISRKFARTVSFNDIKSLCGLPPTPPTRSSRASAGARFSDDDRARIRQGSSR